MADELKWFLKDRVGIFCDISIENMSTSYAVRLALSKTTCIDSAMPLWSCACLYNNSKWCLPSVFSPSACTCYLNSAACLYKHELLRETFLQQLCSKKLSFLFNVHACGNSLISFLYIFCVG